METVPRVTEGGREAAGCLGTRVFERAVDNDCSSAPGVGARRGCPLKGGVLRCSSQRAN